MTVLAGTPRVAFVPVGMLVAAAAGKAASRRPAGRRREPAAGARHAREFQWTQEFAAIIAVSFGDAFKGGEDR